MEGEVEVEIERRRLGGRNMNAGDASSYFEWIT